jgi:hypothetical protein
MKILIIGKSDKSQIELIKWYQNNKEDCKLISENPIILEEEFNWLKEKLKDLL